MRFETVLFLLLCAACPCLADEDLYCGVTTCYDVLGVTQATPLSEITAAYRALARSLHPDKNKDSPDSQASFVLVVRAYEVLKEEKSRSDYDFYLKNPHLRAYNLSRYYQYRYAPRDWRVVVAIFVGSWTLIQYLGQAHKHRAAVDYFKRQPKVQQRAKAVAQERLLEQQKQAQLASSATNRYAKPAAKAVAKQLQVLEAAALEELVAGMEIEGGYAPPTWRTLFCVQVACLPYHAAMALYWHVNWYVRFVHLKQPFGPEENEYRTRVALAVSQSQWDYFEQEEKDDMIARELWVPQNLALYKSEKMTEKSGGSLSGRQKQNLRYLRKYKPNYGSAD